MIIFALLSFPVLWAFAWGKESAWNGQTPPGTDTPGPFWPYYVPPGAKSYDSSSPLIHFTGSWLDSFNSMYVATTLRWTDEKGAAARMTFVGTGIEWFGGLDRSHGIAAVFIDGKKVQEIDTWNNVSRKQQRIFWTFNLPYGKHTIKVINLGKGRVDSPVIDIDAFVVTEGHMTLPMTLPMTLSLTLDLSNAATQPGQIQSFASQTQWTLEQKGVTGVSAMQLTVISDTHALIIDKVEHNPVSIGGHPAWAALFNLRTHAVRPLKVESNSFCAGGTFLSNGTLINVGGNPVVGGYTSAADFGDLDGLQAVRIFEPCPSASAAHCNIYENHSRIRMASPRWYNTVIRISDGSAMIVGGSKKGGWMNNETVNNPTIEYWPPKSIHNSIGLPIHLPFLVRTLNANLFPIVFSLPDDRIFMAANQDAIIYDWRTNQEQHLPRIPNECRVTYPMAAAGLLLPLSPEDGYTAEILLCGGSTIDDKKPGYEISSQDSASSQCSRLLLTDQGIAAGWVVEQMPEARHMPDAVLLPTGEVLIVNGARTGISGYGNSNADHPVLTPVLYDPIASAGQRFSSEGIRSSTIPRMYHSVATLTPSGDIMVAGSNPNLDRSEVKYGTEYRVEWIGPPYMKKNRPLVHKPPKALLYGQNLTLSVKFPPSTDKARNIKVALMDLGFVTHAVHANSRLVYLSSSLFSDGHSLQITGPPRPAVYPPGPGWIYVVVDGVPSVGFQVMVGNGDGPPVDHTAWDNLLKMTAVDQYEASKKTKGKKKGKNVDNTE
ncbi:putative copper radical oxidase [Suillus subaureus]|uniref:Copper radical oxidase n=1 Tax=Suillus subaureus TaxID=48587 RepID=A0A9P7EPH5_9AGAM|nr:putative copper radical oxidase [Suillus subaureus]KAG1826915.1 putative copper radical oxidase [Suillus subaureus]